MQIRRDIYNLSKSQTIEITSKDIDIKADISLYSNIKEINIGASISGTVVDTLNIPIKNAMVKLINNKLESLTNVRTDEKGNYVINFIPSSNIYTLLAIATEKNLNQSEAFSLKNGENRIINFTLSNDPNALFGAINGYLLDENNKVIKGAVIYLYRLNNSLEDLIAIAYSDYEGVFIFSELIPGNYKIKINTLSYIYSEEIIIVERRKIYSFKKVLAIQSYISDGSISGTITDKLNNAISKADVILYKVDENKNQTAVAFTKTNFLGLYSFINVPFGSYFIKSNATQISNINNLIIPSVKITSTMEIDTYNISTGYLENGAKVDYITGFVTDLGGINDGAVTLSVNVEKAGLYNLAIQYTSGDFNRPLKLEVNGKDNGEIYKPPITSGWEIVYTKITYVLTTLNEGVNTIKFHGDGVNLAPNLNMVTLILNETESVTIFSATPSEDTLATTYNIAFGKFIGDVKVNTITKFAEGIGGSKDNSSTITVTVADKAVYYLSIKYLATKNNLNFKVDINNVEDKTIYTVIPTKSLKVSDVATFTLSAALDAGSNTIKFHGDLTNNSPYFEKFTLTLPPVTSNLVNGILENGAKVDSTKKFVIALGGNNKGSTTVTVNTSNSGMFNLIIQYVGSSTLPLKIDINGIASNTIYSLPFTKTLTIKDIKTFTIPVNLNNGNNTLRFYGNEKKPSPNLSSFTLKAINNNSTSNTTSNTLNKEIYNINTAIIGGTALLDKNQNLITGLGGKGNGFFNIDVTVKEDGEYVLRINYKNNNKKFKIDINGKNTGKIYDTLGGFKDLFSTLIKLNKGKSTLKFYGNDTELAPDLGDFYLNLNSPINTRFSDGILSKDAKILPSGAINSLGGFYENYFLINYFANEYGEHLLNLILSSEGGKLLIDVNGNNTNTIYNINSVKTTTVAYNTKIILEEGDNFIKFYGNEKKFVPDIYSIVIKQNFTTSPKQIYEFYSGSLTNSAKLNVYNKFIEGIGTKANGYITLTIEVDSDNFYDFNIEYLSYFQESILYLTINKETNSTMYYFPITGGKANSKSEIFIIERIPLKSGKNILKFSGDSKSPSPLLGTLKVIKSPSIPSSSSENFLVKNGELKNGAKISTISKNFVDGLGGAKDGSSTIEIDNESEGLYYLIIEYLTTDDKNILAVTINDDTTFYNLPKTEKLQESYSKTFLIPIVMKPGSDVIKFHGNKINSTPLLGKLAFTLAPDFTTYNVSEGTLENGALVDIRTGFTTKLGGILKGSSTVKVTVDTSSNYYLTIRYISTATDRSLKLDINGINTGTIYKLPKTSIGTLPNPKTFTIKVPLIEGFNSIKFYGIESLVAPDLEAFIITNNNIIKTYDITKAILSKGAKKFRVPTFICCLGGLRNGQASLKVNIDKKGLYNLAFEYLSGNTIRSLKLKINGESLKTTYKLPPTDDFELKSVKVFTIPINLKNGENEITFYGNYSLTEAPNIGQITISPNIDKPLVIYGFTSGKLKGSATINKDLNVVNNIGGNGKGEVTLTVNVASSGLYNLNIQYVSSKESYLLIDINGTPLKKLCKFLRSYIDDIPNFDTITIEANLISGNNTIRFYYDYSTTPMLSTLTVTPNTSTSKNLPLGSYNVAEGKLENGATIDTTTNFVTKLGGKKNGSSTVTVKTDKKGTYKVSLEYLSPTTQNPFCITVNNKSTGYIYPCAKTKNYSLRVFFEVKLKKGENTIKFYGDGKNEAPDFKIFTLTQQ